MRIGRRTRVKPEAIAEYRRWHREVWPEMLALISAAGIRNYTIFMDGTELFSYLEVDDFGQATAHLARSEVSAKWQELMAPLMDSADAISPWTPLDEVFHHD